MVSPIFHRCALAITGIKRLGLRRLERSGAEADGGEAKDAKNQFTH